MTALRAIFSSPSWHWSAFSVALIPYRRRSLLGVQVREAISRYFICGSASPPMGLGARETDPSSHSGECATRSWATILHTSTSLYIEAASRYSGSSSSSSFSEIPHSSHRGCPEGIGGTLSLPVWYPLIAVAVFRYAHTALCRNPFARFLSRTAPIP